MICSFEYFKNLQNCGFLDKMLVYLPFCGFFWSKCLGWFFGIFGDLRRKLGKLRIFRQNRLLIHESLPTCGFLDKMSIFSQNSWANVLAIFFFFILLESWQNWGFLVKIRLWAIYNMWMQVKLRSFILDKAWIFSQNVFDPWPWPLTFYLDLWPWPWLLSVILHV